jgi:hypothetical protein
MKKKPTPFIVGFFYPRQTPSEWNQGDRVEPARVDLLAPFPTTEPKTVLRLGEVKQAGGKFKWSSGGFAWKGECLLTAVSPAPLRPITRLFVDILEHDSVSDGYYLSPNAADGILRRVRGQNRTLFAPLDQALRRLASSQQKSSSVPEIHPALPEWELSTTCV